MCLVVSVKLIIMMVFFFMMLISRMMLMMVIMFSLLFVSYSVSSVLILVVGRVERIVIGWIKFLYSIFSMIYIVIIVVIIS